MVAVVWSENALHDLELIRSYISGDSVVHANNQIARIVQRTKQIGLFPKSGRIVPEFADKLTRELIEGKYRIIYRIKPNAIRIERIYHGARHLK